MPHFEQRFYQKTSEKTSARKKTKQNPRERRRLELLGSHSDTEETRELSELLRSEQEKSRAEGRKELAPQLREVAQERAGLHSDVVDRAIEEDLIERVSEKSTENEPEHPSNMG